MKSRQTKQYRVITVEPPKKTPQEQERFDRELGEYLYQIHINHSNHSNNNMD